MASTYGEPDMVLVGDLLEEIQRHPPAVGASKLLAEHYLFCGWLDAAREIIDKIRQHAPNDTDIISLAAAVETKPLPSPPKRLPDTPVEHSDSWPLKTEPVPKKVTHPVPQLDNDLDSAQKNLINGYSALRSKAKFLLADVLHLQSLQKKHGVPQSKNIARIQVIANGSNPDSSNRAGPPGSARGVARTIQAKPDKAMKLAIVDLEHTMLWVREPNGLSSGADEDAVRDALVKRVQALEAALPEDLKIHCDLALMHVVHENLNKTYANDETMLGDMVKDIPRDNFYVTEDNYAWDMDELVQAITANGGVMRNPLSRQMFTPKDVRGIMMHPLGKSLAALQVEQHEMSKGVRPDTIEHMETLARILLEDQSSDQLASRHAIDEFVAYLATLPELEQKAIDGLRCPAKDSHTGQPYDFTIGEAVLDAKGNRVCTHKTGDFIKQAVAHLRESRGKPLPDPEDKCTMM